MTQKKISLTFYGAAGTVTGSRYLLNAPNIRVLIDCGLFQGYKILREKNWQPFPVEPNTIQAVYLTHAHLDHSGYLPVLVREGFSGPIYASQATRDLCEILLLDAAKIQEREAYYRNRHSTSKHQPAKPLFTTDDANNALALFKPVKPSINKDTQLTQYPPVKKGELTVKFHPNGHILGSTYLDITIAGKKILFSGDLGRPNDLIMPKPQPPSYCDYLVIESTYGNRKHDDRDVKEIVSTIINSTAKRSGTVLIPSFAVGRAQILIYLLQQLRANGDIPNLPIYLDSPMAINTTDLMCRHNQLHRLNQQQCQSFSQDIHFLKTVEQSIELNTMVMPCVIVSASGMATGGRVLHHLKRLLGDHRNTVVFAGYQAGGTRGAHLVNGQTSVKIHGQQYKVKAKIENLDFLSAHADSDEIVDWLRQIPAAPKQCFITHGEPDAADQLRVILNNELGWPATAVELGQTVYL